MRRRNVCAGCGAISRPRCGNRCGRRRRRPLPLSARKIAQDAQRSVEEWRSALAKNLESIAGALAQKLPGGEK